MTPMSKSECCEASNVVLKSFPPQYKCVKCGRTWFTNEPTPICHQPSGEAAEIARDWLSKKENRELIERIPLEDAPPTREWTSKFLNEGTAQTGIDLSCMIGVMSEILREVEKEAEDRGYRKAMDEILSKNRDWTPDGNLS